MKEDKRVGDESLHGCKSRGRVVFSPRKRMSSMYRGALTRVGKIRSISSEDIKEAQIEGRSTWYLTGVAIGSALLLLYL
jgi:hypothetical protein